MTPPIPPSGAGQSNQASASIGSAGPNYNNDCSQTSATVGVARAAATCTVFQPSYAADAHAETLAGPGGWTSALVALRATQNASTQFQATAQGLLNEVVTLGGRRKISSIARIVITATRYQSQSNLGRTTDSYAEMFAGPVANDPGPQWRAGDFASTTDFSPIINAPLQIQFAGTDVPPTKRFFLGLIAQATVVATTANTMMMGASNVEFPTIALFDAQNNDVTSHYTIKFASTKKGP